MELRFPEKCRSAELGQWSGCTQAGDCPELESFSAHAVSDLPGHFAAVPVEQGWVTPSREPRAAVDGTALLAPLCRHTAPKVGCPQALGSAGTAQAPLTFSPVLHCPEVPLSAGCPTVPAAGSKGAAEFSYFLFGAKAQDIFSIGSALTTNLHKVWSVDISVQV